MARIHARVLEVALSLLLLVPLTARAQSDLGAPLGRLYLSAAPDLQVDTLPAASVGEVVEFYLVLEIDFTGVGDPALNADNGVLAWEAGVRLPDELLLLDTRLRPAGGVNLGSGPTDWSVGVGTAGLPASSTPFAVVVMRCLIAAPVAQTRRIEIVPALRPSLDPPVPLWVESLPVNGCTNPLDGTAARCLRPFAAVEGLDLPVTVGVAAASWGTLKGRFGP